MVITNLKQPETHGLRREFETVKSEVNYTLNSILADQFSLLTQTWIAHWNIRGNLFYTLHNLLGEQYQKLIKMVDAVAERNRQLGGKTLLSLSEISSRNSLKPIQNPESQSEVVSGLETCHLQVAKEIRDILASDLLSPDPVTVDLMTEQLKNHEKMAWVLNAHKM